MAPAKINLYLEVLGQRPNGYHDLRSVVVPISISDKLLLEKTDSEIRTIFKNGHVVHGEELRPLAKARQDLATRAAMTLREVTGYNGGARIEIEKDIPIGGGLGGGSADAAGVLRGLNELWGTGVPTERLMEIGAKLGCDIPAMVHGGSVCMEGLGETVSRIELTGPQGREGWWLVVVNPGFSVSTRDIYSRYTRVLTCGGAGLKSIVSALKDGDLEAASKLLFNSLEETVFRKYPLIGMLAESLKESGAVAVLLCGSGASVFGLTRSEAEARGIAERVVAKMGPQVWSRVARTLPDGVMVAHGPLEA